MWFRILLDTLNPLNQALYLDIRKLSQQTSEISELILNWTHHTVYSVAGDGGGGLVTLSILWGKLFYSAIGYPNLYP